MTLNPYLNFPGTTEEAFNFYKSVFGGEFLNLQRFKDTPEADRVPDSEKEKIMHIAMKVGGNTLMATDALESMGHLVTYGNAFHLSVDAESVEEANTLYASLSTGGRAVMPLMKMFWGSYFVMLTDKFGIQWMINFDDNKK